MNILKRIFTILILCISIANATAQDTYVSVEIPVYSENENPETAKNTALELGKNAAFQAVVDQICNGTRSCVNKTFKELPECIDGYSIKNEVIGSKSYRANVTYRINLTALATALKNKKVTSEVVENHAKLIVIDSNDISNVHSQLKSREKQIIHFPYSFTRTSVKYRYSRYLDELLKTLNIGYRHEDID